MPLDRTGEPVDDSAPWHDPRCRDGWLSGDDADIAIACPLHRPPRNTIHDYAERTPSLRAQAAIERDSRHG
uniref:hypothetical protein n=1 Tax=Nocardia suismassiliense TaxID=2077092 RepID=UPI003F491A87